MNKYLLYLLLFFGSELSAQEVLKTAFYKGNTETNEEKSEYSRAIVSTSKEGLYAFVEKWRDGSLKRRGFASEYNPKFKQIGKETIYYRNGAVQQIQYIKNSQSVGKIQTFYANGNLKEEGTFQQPTLLITATRFDAPNYIVKQIADSLGNNFLDSTASGKVNIAYANGDLLAGEYINGLKHGQRREYIAETGETYIEEYEHGKFIRGRFIDRDNKKADYKGKEQFPEFKGGMKEFYTFLSRNIKYPALMKENNIQGRVTVNFSVEKDGTLSNFKILKGIPDGRELDEEALRVLKLSPKWNPGIQRGKPVRVSYSVPIVFSLNTKNQ